MAKNATVGTESEPERGASAPASGLGPDSGALSSDLEKLNSIRPARPPTKQARFDALIDHIDEKLSQGVTVDQIREALAPEETYKAFHSMLRRARAKREKREARHLKKALEIEPPSAVPSAGEAGAPSSPPASVARAATSGDRPEAGHSPATGRGAPRPASPHSERAGSAGPGKAGATAPAAAQDGKGVPAEFREYCTTQAGDVIEPQSALIPPPWEPGTPDAGDMPLEIPHRNRLVKAKTWLEVHWLLALFEKSPEKTKSNAKMLRQAFEKSCPQSVSGPDYEV